MSEIVFMKHEIRAGAYYDSVVLMQLQKSLAGLPGVVDAGVVMATPANLDVLLASGFILDGITAHPDDLLIMVKGESETAVVTAITQVDTLLKQRQSSTTQTYRPRSLSAAADSLPSANWMLISVPGRYAAGVAEEALDLGKHVFLYSDNVTLADEIKLKQKAREKGLLLMGPDCGTAVINGIGLGFANRVRRGNIGVVAASGTGLQAVIAGVHNLESGISQAFGTGGRDLKADVGGITALQGLDFLAHDPQTDVIVLVSKPPAASVATKLLAAAQSCGKPVVVNFIGYPPPARRLGNLFFVTNLDDAVKTAVALSQNLPIIDPPKQPISGYLRGLFSGGTLAYEVLLGLQAVLAPIYSNIPIQPEQKLADSLTSQAHTILDLGEDEFTQGRLHPMMDNDLRLRRIREETADSETGLLLLDVVLGEGAHPDPAAELAPAIAEAKQKRELEVVVIILGTDADPQNIDAQIAGFEEAGAVVFRKTSEVVAYVSQRMQPQITYDYPSLPNAHFGDQLAAINVGLESFYDSLQSQGGEAIQVDWKPPAGGNEKLMAILAMMKS